MQEYCDYNILESYAEELKTNFNGLNNSLNNIDMSIKSITNSSNWDSQTKEYVLSLYTTMQDNFNIIANRLKNISDYLENVVGNYRVMEYENVLH